MPGKNFQLTPLESRKQLLLVESELNRAQLLNELHGLNQEIHRLQDQMQAVGSLAASAARLAGTFSAIGNVFSHGQKDDRKDKKKSSWFSTLLKGAQTGASIWGAWRSGGR